ncbi:hypothetical protein [Ancylobacter terrae]|uniref:hypothetical protein n=1 Tax=Ancylobacter sp. sgz301288 TaxID=3342077 RepID=UPI00385CF319
MLDRTHGQLPALADEPAARPSARHTPATALYLAITAQIHQRIRRLGITMARCDDLSGLQDGYVAKLLHPDTKTGRQANWATLQLLVDAVFPDGYDIIIRPRDGRKAEKLVPETNPTVDARTRSVMAAMGRKGGLKSWEVRKAKLTAAEQRLVEENPRRARRRLGKKLRGERA